MERRLILLRHANAALTADEDDHARVLDAHGREQAARIGKRLRAAGWVPEVVVCSDSARTRETWRIVQQQLGQDDIDVRFLRSLYDDGNRGLREAAGDIDIKVHTVLALGHNPSFSTLASALSGQHVGLSSGNAALLSSDAAAWDEALLHDGMWQLDGRIDGD